jgi:hypothetical protein
MTAAWTTTIQSAMVAERMCGERMPACQPQTCVSHAGMRGMATPATTGIIETSVPALVSLFAVGLFLLRGLLLVAILALSGLTGLVSLVGLTAELSKSALQGD